MVLTLLCFNYNCYIVAIFSIAVSRDRMRKKGIDFRNAKSFVECTDEFSSDQRIQEKDHREQVDTQQLENNALHNYTTTDLPQETDKHSKNGGRSKNETTMELSTIIDDCHVQRKTEDRVIKTRRSWLKDARLYKVKRRFSFTFPSDKIYCLTQSQTALPFSVATKSTALKRRKLFTELPEFPLLTLLAFSCLFVCLFSVVLSVYQSAGLFGILSSPPVCRLL